jgi:PAS domain S-box-containing protein
MNLIHYLQRRGLGTYLALAFAAMSALLTLLLVVVIGVTAGDRVRLNIGQGLGELALQTSDKLDRGMFERYREVRMLAERFRPDQPGARNYLTTLQESYPYYAWIGAASLDGKVQVSARGVLEKVDVGQRPWFKNALDGNFLGDVHEAVLLAKHMPYKTKEPPRFVDVAFPYRNEDGTVAGVLGVHLSWEWARDVQRSIIEPLAARRQVQSLILNSAGDVLLGPEDLMGTRLSVPSQTAAASGNGGFTVEDWPDGKQYLVGYSKSTGFSTYPGLGWTVLVRQETDIAFLPVKHIQRDVLAKGLGIALLFSLFGWLIARRISRPLWRLTVSAGRIEAGENHIIPDHSADFFEVRTLAKSIASLVGRLLQKERALKELNQTLEQRVQVRTAELATALATVEASQDRIRNILETVQDAFIGVNLDGAITDWNARAVQMFGWSKAEAIGQQAAMLIAPERMWPKLTEALHSLAKSQETSSLNRRLEWVALNRAGSEFPVEVTIGLAGEQDSAFFGIFLHDISERKKIAQMKDEFVATVSHELRTPLTAIYGSLSLLASGIAGDLEPDVKQLLNISYGSCERLVRLVNDILDIEKIESGNMELILARRPLLSLVESAVASTNAYAQPFNVALRIESDGSNPEVMADRDRIIQVVVNLLSNAVKFSPAGSTVLVTVATDGVLARLSVRDYGTGIPPEFHDRIFQKFAQADASDTRRRDGTGLGLAISRQLVAAHGGQIGFSTVAGEGTTFTVDLPLAT